MNDIVTAAQHGQRGPIDSSRRDQIMIAAKEHFSLYGYGKTTVSDLAKAIGFSKAYIYKFYESKQAIGEAICADCLNQILDATEAALAGKVSATERFRTLFKTLVQKSVDLFFADRKLYDIAASSTAEKWASSDDYERAIYQAVEQIILAGRESGEFERKTPLDEVCRSIVLVMQPFLNPIMLQYNLDAVPDAPNEVASLVLRSLAP